MKIRAGFVSNSSSSSFIVASKHHNVSEAKRISEFEEVYEDGTVWNEDFANELKKLIRFDLIKIENGNVFLTSKGLDLANLVWEEFI